MVLFHKMYFVRYGRRDSSDCRGSICDGRNTFSFTEGIISILLSVCWQHTYYDDFYNIIILYRAVCMGDCYAKQDSILKNGTVLFLCTRAPR